MTIKENSTDVKTIDVQPTDVQQYQWQVWGRCYDETDPPDPSGVTQFCPGAITIPEQASNLSMGTGPATPPKIASVSGTNSDDTFGVPVDADLAVNLIKNALATTNSYIKTHHANAMETNSKEAGFVAGLLNLSYGITFDKSIILKILSQPNCEGLRAYACSRNTGGQDTSLVLVGVDVNGYDLYYGNNSSVNAITGSTIIPTSSLIVEYGYPPGSTGVQVEKLVEGNDMPSIAPNYVLLQYASGMLTGAK